MGRPYCELTADFLPSSLTKILSCTVGLLDRQTCVGFSTVAVSLALEIFLESSSPQIGNLLLDRLQTTSWNIAPDLPGAILEAINAYTNIALEVQKINDANAKAEQEKAKAEEQKENMQKEILYYKGGEKG